MLRKSREDLSALTKQGHYPPYERVVLKEGGHQDSLTHLGDIGPGAALLGMLMGPLSWEEQGNLQACGRHEEWIWVLGALPLPPAILSTSVLHSQLQAAGGDPGPHRRHCLAEAEQGAAPAVRNCP